MIALLSSGVTLGTYVPALILAHRLRAAGAVVRTEVLERSLNRTELDRLGDMKSAFRANFAVALASQRMVRDRTPALDSEEVAKLVKQWRAERIRVLVIFSGFWVPIVEQYEAVADHPVQVDVCHLDCAATTSLSLFDSRVERFRHVWFFKEPPDAVRMSIPVSDEPVVPWSRRVKRLLAHGGGWGLGTYRNRAKEVVRQGLDVDMVVHDPSDIEAAVRGMAYYLVDPAWEAWRDGGFPPLGKVHGNRPTKFRRTTTYHGSFDLARQRVAMMCKTGGGSLLDSLWAATPIVSLEPFGAHERANSELWQRLGFGVSFETWRNSGYSLDLLEQLHRNLLRARDRVPDYTADLAAISSGG